MATTTPNFGWDVPTSSDYVKLGAVAIETLGDDIDATLWTALGANYPGLRLVKKQTIGTGVSSVAVTGAFSATYENYKIVISGGVGSTNAALSLTFGATGGTAYKYTFLYTPYNTTPTALASGGTSSFFYCSNATTSGLMGNVEVNSPFLSTFTGISSIWNSPTESGTVTGIINNTTSYTGFTFTANSGTLTGGTIYVYGYGAS